MTAFSTGHAVVVGVGADLPNTVDDAQAIANVLRDDGRCAYPPGQVELLTQEKASRAGLLVALDRLANRTNEESAALIYYSGHGYVVEKDGHKDYFLLPHGYDLQRLDETCVSDACFTAALAKLKVKRLLLLLDCCHAAGLDQAKAPGAALTKSALPPQAVAMLEAGEGRVVVASSRAGELSFAGKPYSVFTQAMIESLAGIGASQQDGFVRLADLALYAGWRVPGLTKDRQHPVLNFRKADNFPVAYYAGGDLKPKEPPFGVPANLDAEARAWTVANLNVANLNFGSQTVGKQINVGGNATINENGD